MIPRILVPKGACLPTATEGPPRRLSSELDERTLVPQNLPRFELDARTSIPAYLPLDVLASRVVVPRDMPSTPLDTRATVPDYFPRTALDSRIAVPKDALPPSVEPKPLVLIQDLPDVLDPDVITTGEVNLMARPVEERLSSWNAIARVASIAFHFAVILFFLFEPKLFPYQGPTQAEIERQQMTYLYLPPDVSDVPKVPSPPQPSSPQIRIDPRVLRRLAPSELQPTPGRPEPAPVIRDTPPAPPLKPAPPAPTPAPAPAPQGMPRPKSPPASPNSIFQPVEPPQQDTTSSRLVLPHFSSPGKALQDSLREALKNSGGPDAQFGGPAPVVPGGGGPPVGGGGGGQGYLGGNVQLLTPTEGVDFTNYLARVLASVKRNWYAAMPESARLGDKGRVVLQFRIMHNGVVPDGEPALYGSSGKDPLDRAAMSSIRASTPFEPLPAAFSGPYIELRFIFLYNLPLNYQ
jgi:outer membrane biosynthesis protein TonB